MTMQINVNPDALTQEQREAVAGFILAYPRRIPNTLDFAVTLDTKRAHTAISELQTHAHTAGLTSEQTQAVGATIDPAVAQLVQDDAAFQASLHAHGSPDLDADAAKLNAIFGSGAAGPTLAEMGMASGPAFGSIPVTFPIGAPAAPSTAVAAPPVTSPVATTVTLTAPQIVPPPPAPPAAPVGTIVAPPAQNPVGGVDLDKNGLPWDGRIHASTKRKNVDSTWTGRRGVSADVIAQVTAELRQVMGAVPLSSATTVTAPAGFTPVPTLAPVGAAVVAPPPPPSTTPDDRQHFASLVGRASAAMGAGKITLADVTAICTAVGVPALPLLANRLDLVPHVAAQIDALIASKG